MSLGNWKAFNLLDVGLINFDMMVMHGAQESLEIPIFYRFYRVGNFCIRPPIQLPYIKEMYTVGLLNITYMKERRMTTLLGPKGQTGKQAYIITQD